MPKYTQDVVDHVTAIADAIYLKFRQQVGGLEDLEYLRRTQPLRFKIWDEQLEYYEELINSLKD